MEGRDAYAQSMREGHVHAWAGRWHEAATSYRAALKALPGDASARTSLGAAFAHAGLPAEALAVLEELAVERPDDSALTLRIAELRHRIGRMDDADAAYLRVASLYLAVGQRDKALAVWRRLIELSGHRAATMSHLAEAATGAEAEDVASEARALAEATSARAVVDDRVAESARRSDEPGDGDATSDLAAALRERGLVTPRFDQRRTFAAAPARASAAVDDALAALAHHPFDLVAARDLGSALAAGGARTAAIRQLADALEVAELAGELDIAVQLIRDLLPLADDPAPLYQRIVRLALLGEATEVGADAYLALARHLIERGDAGGALTACRRARTVAPLNARIQAAAADLFRRLGEHQEADDAYRRAFQLAPRVAAHAVAYAASAARRGAVDEIGIALDALASADAPAAPSVVLRAIERDLGGDAPPVRWCRGRLRELVGDAEAESDLTAAARGAPPIGALATVHLAQRAIESRQAARVLDLVALWLVTPSLLDELPELRERIAGLALSAADAAGDGATAIASLRVLAAANPDDPTVAALLAERLAASGDLAAAAAELAGLAARERTSGNLEAAAALLDSAVELAPADPRLATEAAELALARGDRDLARQRYLQAAQASGGTALAALLSAAQLAPWSARVGILRRAAAEFPREPEPRRRLVSALIGAGQAGQAALAAASLAELLHASGDRAGALAALDQARRLDPWNSGLAALQEAIAAERATPE